MSFLTPSDEDYSNFREKLVNALGISYKVESHKEVSGFFGSSKKLFDYVIFHEDLPLVGVEYKYKYAFPFIDINSNVYINQFREVGLQYGIMYFGEKNDIYFWKKGASRFDKFSFDDIIAAIIGNISYGKEPTADNIVEAIFNGNRSKTIAEMPKEKIDLIKSFLEDESIYVKKDGYISLKPESEDKLFLLLLPDEKPQEVCRYTSLKSLYILMESKKQCLCSITCMNDRGEISYADRYVTYGAYSTTSDMIKDNNDCFILSCCKMDRFDDLTMWRLYGDDGKGSCIRYDVNYSLVDNKEFFLAPVSYGKDKDDHPELELIIAIKQLTVNGWKFRLNRWRIWKHFFKSYLFRDESEVRLLYKLTENLQDNAQWIMDSTNKIVSRIFLLRLVNSNFPLKLKSATIGPKCPEQMCNVDQFNYMNTIQNVFLSTDRIPGISASKIEDYR